MIELLLAILFAIFSFGSADLDAGVHGGWKVSKKYASKRAHGKYIHRNGWKISEKHLGKRYITNTVRRAPSSDSAQQLAGCDCAVKKCLCKKPSLAKKPLIRDTRSNTIVKRQESIGTVYRSKHCKDGVCRISNWQ